jgi:putative endonuclease
MGEHKAGKVESTKNRRPLKLIYYEAYLEKDDAENRERFLKSGSGKGYIKKQLRIYFEKNALT